MSRSLTLLFPGQGSQYKGMGSQFADKSYFEQADAQLGFSLSQIAFEDAEDQLKLTAYTQPAILTHSLSLFKQLQNFLTDKTASIDYVLGHSIGEYSALVAANALDFKDAVRAVHARGMAMQNAVPVGEGKMLAILREEASLVEQACREASNTLETVYPANYNEPQQIVISGHNAACDRALEYLRANSPSARVRAIPLKVSAPFHSPLMHPAAQKMQEVLSRLPFRSPCYPYIANIDAKIYGQETEPQEIIQNLIQQVCGSVLWTQSIQRLPKDQLLLEVGPGKILARLVKKIDPHLEIISLDQENAFEELKERL